MLSQSRLVWLAAALREYRLVLVVTDCRAERSTDRPGRPAGPPHRRRRGGDTIAYEYTITNTGNVTMDHLAMTDSAAGPGTCPTATLTAGTSMTCAGGNLYLVTQGDVDAGRPIVVTAVVTGRKPGSATALTFGSVPASIAVAATAAALGITTTSDVTNVGQQAGMATTARTPTGGLPAVNDTIQFRYVVTNTGNVTMYQVGVYDSLVGPATCPVTTLTVAAATTCTADLLYTVTQSDIDHGWPIMNSARASGIEPSAGIAHTSGSASVSVPIEPAAPKVTANQAAKWSDTDGDGKLGTADDIVSTIVVFNNGNVTLTDLRVTGLPAEITCTATTLPPGGRATCASGIYHLTEADIAAGRRTYTATINTTTNAEPEVDTTAPATIVAPGATPTPTSPTPSATSSPFPTTSASPRTTPSPRAPSSADPPRTSPDDASPIPTTGFNTLAVLAASLALITGGLALLLLTRHSRQCLTRNSRSAPFVGRHRRDSKPLAELRLSVRRGPSQTHRLGL